MREADHKELRVHKLACEPAMEISELSPQWPEGEKQSRTDQIRRSSRLVCTNIAESWRKRCDEGAFISKLSVRDREAAEIEAHRRFAMSCGHLHLDQHAKLKDNYDHIRHQLRKMMDDAPSRCGTGHELREVPRECFAEPENVGSRSFKEAVPHSDAADAPRSRRG